MNEFEKLLNIENPFDLNECYICCDMYAKKYRKLYEEEKVSFLNDWNDIFQALYELASQRYKTSDLNEAVIDPRELENFRYNGIIFDEYPLIKNEMIAINFYYRTTDEKGLELKCEIDFKADELTYNDLPNEIENKALYYKKEFDGEYIKIDVMGPFRPFIENGFSFASNSLLAQNIQYFYLSLKEFCRKHHLNFYFPDWFLIYRLNYLSDNILNNMEVDTKILSTAVLNQISNDNKYFARKNITLAKEKLNEDFYKLADFFHCLILKYCLENHH